MMALFDAAVLFCIYILKGAEISAPRLKIELRQHSGRWVQSAAQLNKRCRVFPGSMTIFYFSTKSYTQGKKKRHWCERRENCMIWMYSGVCSFMASGSLKSQRIVVPRCSSDAWNALLTRHLTLLVDNPTQSTLSVEETKKKKRKRSERKIRSSWLHLGEEFHFEIFLGQQQPRVEHNREK